MNKSLVALALLAFQPALPGYPFHFPRDHASHGDYKTEWWYYTGNLQGPAGRRFGYELTFFRFGLERERPAAGASRWRFPDLYVAHFAISDEAQRRFRFGERVNRPGLGLAGASEDRYKVFNGTWTASLLSDGRHHLVARDGDGAIDLVLDAMKPPVLHGHDGVSQKAGCKGCASHYYSLTRMKTSGILALGRERLPVQGLTWMDHEFGSNELAADQTGWDWFSLQLSDGTELMLYQLRLKDGRTEPNSSGTFVRKDGSWRHLVLGTWSADPRGSWTSPHSNGRYPAGWHVAVPSEQLDLTVTPAFADQELRFPEPFFGSTYWEGACHVAGSHAGATVGGDGYVELTGYAPSSRPNL